MSDKINLKISNGHLIKIVKNPKDTNGYKYLGIYQKKIEKEDKN